jgi:hypothetical protein
MYLPTIAVVLFAALVWRFVVYRRLRPKITCSFQKPKPVPLPQLNGDVLADFAAFDGANHKDGYGRRKLAQMFNACDLNVVVG